MQRRIHYAALTAAALSATLLMACGEREDATVGQRVDSTVNSTESAAADVRADAKEAGQELKAAGNEAGDKLSAAGDKIAAGAADMAITAKVNAALAGDSQLSALGINVDTQNGLVELKGTAPDAAARDRATVLASAVEGVLKVDNRLTIEAKG